MIERFNFYDVFGFLIPGSVLFLALAIPLSLARGQAPDADLASALAAIVAAYLAGHFLQAFAHHGFPSTTGGRHPSSFLLDPGAGLPDELRETIEFLASREYRLNIRAPVARPEAADKQRQTVFFQARERLLAAGAMTYPEQFQGLYTMMRGNMVASSIGAAHTCGWAVGAGLIRVPAVVGCMVLLVLVLLAVVDRRSNREQRHARRVIELLIALALAIGLAASPYWSLPLPTRLTLAGISAGWICLAVQSSRSYAYYSRQFAAALYRAFVEHSSRTGQHHSNLI
ncbi:MAG: hypothetical protein WD227_16550 [Vicinamibacterales bacterium]